MGSLYRSEEMGLYQLFLHNEVAYDCISELGELGLVEFRDLNTDVNIHQRRFVKEVRRCANMERKLRYLEKEIDKSGISKNRKEEKSDIAQACELVDLETKITNFEHELLEVNKTILILKRNLLELTELKYILQGTQHFFEDEGESSSTESMTRDLVRDSRSAQHTAVHLGFVTGVINRERFPAFERMLWRAYRGNVYLRHSEIKTPLEDPSTGDLMHKSMFMVLFQEQLRPLVTKICEGFAATLYSCPESTNKRRQMAFTVMTKRQDLNLVLGKTLDLRITLMLAVAKYVHQWHAKIIKIKAIYHTLNLFNVDVTKKCLIGECWMPVGDIHKVHTGLQQGKMRSDSAVPPIINRLEISDEDPPTFIRTNKFTNGFQLLIDAYGVANYREINPTPYTIITFPFLFAVMFGDFGHGLIMFLFASCMILKEKRVASKNPDNEIWRIFFGGRYVILLMGMFSMYTGFIYNDMFSKSTNIFGSHWNVSVPFKEVMVDKHILLDPKDYYSNTPYPVGMDPVWQIAENKIRFLNAYKMKISIIIGVLHMLFGVSLSVFNYIYFKRKVDILVLFLPEIIFLLSLFFYLVVLIFIKWVVYGADNPVETSPGCAPSILVTFINMVLLSPGIASEPCSPWMFSGQLYIQHLLVIVAVICIPWLLIAKPCLKLREQKRLDNRENKSKTPVLDNTNRVDKIELWINQAIHTIEYVLGSVSHTASYLRLWALSLAHGQLSEVLWMMVMKPALMSHSHLGGLALFLVFPCWAVLTIGVLVLMEGLSAFLHTLRLHWVEFQSKFYVGAGHKFTPFSFESILSS